MSNTGTIISQLTPTGRGAVATILIAGPKALDLVSGCFSPASGKSLAEIPGQRIVFGSFSSLDAIAEDVVVGLQSANHLEIHCHGGLFSAAAVMTKLVQNGGEIVPWQQAMALLGPDRLCGEARIALAEAQTERTANILLEQFHGALRKCIDEIRDGLAGAITNKPVAMQRLERLLDLVSLGKHLTTPWRVVIAGPPNVGKSSLMNALVGYQRSIVFDQPGTTRDLLTATTALDGWPIELVDCAGLRDGADLLESAGIERAKAELTKADLVLWVEDASAQADACRISHSNVPYTCPTLVVKNKADLLPSAAAYDANSVAVSALTGRGVAELCQRILRKLIPVLPLPGEGVVFTQRQENAVRQAASAMEHGNPAQAETWLRSL